MTERSRGGTFNLPLPCNAGLGTNCKGEVVKPGLDVAPALPAARAIEADFANKALSVEAAPSLLNCKVAASATACASSSRAQVSPCALA